MLPSSRLARPAAQPSLLQSLLQLRPKADAPLVNSAGEGTSGLPSPMESLASSPRELSVAQFDEPTALVGATEAAVGSSRVVPAAPRQQQQQPAPWPRFAQLQAAGTGLFQTSGTSDWIRNPAAALSSLTTRIGTHLQPG